MHLQFQWLLSYWQFLILFMLQNISGTHAANWLHKQAADVP